MFIVLSFSLSTVLHASPQPCGGTVFTIGELAVLTEEGRLGTAQLWDPGCSEGLYSTSLYRAETEEWA